MKKNRPAQDRYPGWEQHEHKMDGWDWVISALAAFCMALGVYIYFNVPDAWYYTVVVGATIAKLLFWWVIAGICVIIAWNMIKSAVRSDRNRTRTHK